MNHGLFVSWRGKKTGRRRTVSPQTYSEYDYLRTNYAFYELTPGEQLNIQCNLTLHGELLTNRNIVSLEVFIGTLHKSASDIKFRTGTGTWDFTVTYEEALSFSKSPVRIKVRVNFSRGNVVEGDAGAIVIIASTSNTATFPHDNVMTYMIDMAFDDMFVYNCPICRVEILPLNEYMSLQKKDRETLYFCTMEFEDGTIIISAIYQGDIDLFNNPVAISDERYELTFVKLQRLLTSDGRPLVTADGKRLYVRKQRQEE